MVTIEKERRMLRISYVLGISVLLGLFDCVFFIEIVNYLRGDLADQVLAKYVALAIAIFYALNISGGIFYALRKSLNPDYPLNLLYWIFLFILGIGIFILNFILTGDLNLSYIGLFALAIFLFFYAIYNYILYTVYKNRKLLFLTISCFVAVILFLLFFEWSDYFMGISKKSFALILLISINFIIKLLLLIFCLCLFINFLVKYLKQRIDSAISTKIAVLRIVLTALFGLALFIVGFIVSDC